MKIRLLPALGLAMAILSGCGGPVDEPAAPLAAVARAGAPVPITPAEVMDWAELSYPQFFPGHQADQVLDPFVYRHYPATNNYLGLWGDSIYVMGGSFGGFTPRRVGSVDDFHCYIRPAECLGGTVATGAPMAGATVTVIDSLGHSASTTTAANGSYTLITGKTNLGPRPWLVRAAPVTGTVLYSVTADATSTVANITPWTDLIVRGWYGVQGVEPAAAFAAPLTYPPPNATQVGLLGQPLLDVAQLGISVYGAGITSAQGFITQPFNADGTGADALLAHTQFSTSTGGAAIVLSTGSVTQTSVLTFTTATSSITATSTATDGISVTVSAGTQVIPVQPAQATALDAILANLSAFASTVNAKGGALTAGDLLPYMSTDFIYDGTGRDAFAANLVGQFAGANGSLAFQVARVNRLDALGGTAEVQVRIAATTQDGADSGIETFTFARQAGEWLFSGNGRIAKVNVQAEGRRNQGRYAQDNGPSINYDVDAPLGTVTGVHATVPGSPGTVAFTQGSVRVDGSEQRNSFFYNTGALTGTLPAAGTPITVTLTKSGGATVSYVLALNVFTTELISITMPTGASLADAHLGGTLHVAWTLPKTYAVVEQQVSALAFTSVDQGSGYSCEWSRQQLPVTATAADLAMETTCNGLPVLSVNINLHTTGPNGERSMVIYMMGN